MTMLEYLENQANKLILDIKTVRDHEVQKTDRYFTYGRVQIYQVGSNVVRIDIVEG